MLKYRLVYLVYFLVIAANAEEHAPQGNTRASAGPRPNLVFLRVNQKGDLETYAVERSKKLKACGYQIREDWQPSSAADSTPAIDSVLNFLDRTLTNPDEIIWVDGHGIVTDDSKKNYRIDPDGFDIDGDQLISKIRSRRKGNAIFLDTCYSGGCAKTHCAVGTPCGERQAVHASAQSTNAFVELLCDANQACHYFSGKSSKEKNIPAFDTAPQDGVLEGKEIDNYLKWSMGTAPDEVKHFEVETLEAVEEARKSCEKNKGNFFLGTRSFYRNRVRITDSNGRISEGAPDKTYTPLTAKAMQFTYNLSAEVLYSLIPKHRLGAKIEVAADKNSAKATLSDGTEITFRFEFISARAYEGSCSSSTTVAADKDGFTPKVSSDFRIRCLSKK